MSTLNTIPERQGERPITGDALPHLQFTDNSSKIIYDALAQWLFGLAHIQERPSIVSVHGARAAWIEDSYANFNQQAVQFGREFTHIHPAVDNDHGGSLHLTLTREDCEAVIAKGWGEYHPMDPIAYPEKQFGHILVYAPRTEEELDIVKDIVTAAYCLATNQKTIPQTV